MFSVEIKAMVNRNGTKHKDSQFIKILIYTLKLYTIYIYRIFVRVNEFVRIYIASADSFTG